MVNVGIALALGCSVTGLVLAVLALMKALEVDDVASRLKHFRKELFNIERDFVDHLQVYANTGKVATELHKIHKTNIIDHGERLCVVESCLRDIFTSKKMLPAPKKVKGGKK